MEPTNLNSPLPDDERLAAWYRANVSDAALPDEGFTHSVLVALPPARPSIAARRRLFVLVGALIGTAVAFVKDFASGRTLPDFPEFASNVSGALALPASAVLLLALGISALSLWYVIRPKLNFLPRF